MDTSSSTQTSDLPDWAKPYVTGMLEQAQKVASQPYQPYGGQRFVGYNPLETTAYSGLMGLAPSQQMGQASNMARMAGMGAGMAGLNYQQQATNPYAMQAYMSPYMQNVVGQQQAGAIRDYARQLPGMSAAATQAGGLGGSRQALVQAEGQRNLQNQLANIQATGSQQAFQNAQQAQQFGAGLGLQGLQTQLQGAQTLGGLGQQQFNQALQAAQAQQAGGTQMRGIEQQRLDAMYQDYLAQQGYPQQQLGFMGNILRGGTPSQEQISKTTSQPSPSTWSQVLGAGTAAYGMGKQFGWW